MTGLIYELPERNPMCRSCKHYVENPFGNDGLCEAWNDIVNSDWVCDAYEQENVLLLREIVRR